ncbi:MAG: MCE family protein [Bacteroidaceae bacterium]|nr:MCE family protein [Bacteroidaceae bacterium]MBR3444029.1 MCE family protein [Bacteroidaceae bacterium]
MKFSKEIKIALVTIVAILIVYFGIMFLKNIKLARTNNVYYVEMSDVNGLSPQAEVLANGMNIGTVKSLTYDAKRQLVVVAVDLAEGYQVPKGSTATLSKDMLGSPKMRVILGDDPASVLQAGDTIPGFPMSDLMASAGELVPSVKALVPKLDSILTALNTLANDPALPATLHNLEYVTGNLRTTTDRLNHMLGNDVPQLMARVNRVGGNLEETTAKLNQVDFAGMSSRANQTLDDLNLFTNRLNNENSTLGRLMNDASVYNHLDSTMLNASRLLEDLRLHPKRYVHFSLFGKKDK